MFSKSTFAAIGASALLGTAPAFAHHPGARRAGIVRQTGSGFASVGVPIVNELSGIQSKPDFRVMTGIAAAF